MDPVEKFLRDARALRSVTHLTLGRLINYLENTEDHPVANLTRPHCYRGYYEDLAFEFKGGETSSKSLLMVCKDLVGRRLIGYRGGEYKMTLNTPIWIANYGESGRPLISLNYTSLELGNLQH